MKNLGLMLLISTVMSAPTIANTNDKEEKLFGEYPAKYFCIKKNRKIVKCHVPTIEQINEEIANYNNGIEQRYALLNEYLAQNDSYKEELLTIAQERINEIGENTFSHFYQTYADKLDNMTRNSLPEETDAEVELGSKGEYIGLLKQVRDLVADEASELEFGELTLNYKAQNKIKNYNSLLSRLETRGRFGPKYSYDFRHLIPLSQSCTKLKGYGQFTMKRVEVNAFSVAGYKSFDLIQDQELLKELLSSNDGAPLKVVCEKKKKNTALRLEYRKTQSTLVIPYRIHKEISSKAGSFGFELRKDIVIPDNGFFNEELKEVLKK